MGAATNLKPTSKTPWFVGGDFNEIMQHSEKWGGNPRSERQLRLFQEALDYCHLGDLGYPGSKFTWCN